MRAGWLRGDREDDGRPELSRLHTDQDTHMLVFFACYFAHRACPPIKTRTLRSGVSKKERHAEWLCG